MSAMIVSCSLPLFLCLLFQNSAVIGPSLPFSLKFWKNSCSHRIMHSGDPSHPPLFEGE
ncbi:hypothetical protein KP509_12G041600 [Ceratopteris richardii]|uniref:Uncharacterized protein n=1 Tax=Ceratopteris richardii TaxID=49495 RepID=A0A8T2TNZ4_CERRI|nr:hypothetical protein KP509_12G041600 [Ceratopteris richardii]